MSSVSYTHLFPYITQDGADVMPESESKPEAYICNLTPGTVVELQIYASGLLSLSGMTSAPSCVMYGNGFCPADVYTRQAQEPAVSHRKSVCIIIRKGKEELRMNQQGS